MQNKDKHHHRFFVDPKLIQGDFFSSNDKVLINQIKNVFRLKTGSEILILDNTGYEYVVKITKLTNNIEGKIVKKIKQKQPEKKINLFCSILKGDNFEFVLQKVTELGIAEITPVIFQNSLKKDIVNKIDRWNKIIKEASEQSMRFFLPELNKAVEFGKAIQQVENKFNLVADQESKINLLKYSEKIRKEKIINIFAGPEGDFSEKEKEIMVKAGFLFYNLGNNTLRSETACIASAGIISQIML